jgi:hypothetical protein
MERIYQNKILFDVPEGFSELSARKLDLDRMTDGVPAEMREFYAALAADFRAIGYTFNADACDRRAEQWRRIGTRERLVMP